VGIPYAQAEKLADLHEQATVIAKGQDWVEHQKLMSKLIDLIRARQEKVINPVDTVNHGE
jgi:hypothetical protein